MNREAERPDQALMDVLPSNELSTPRRVREDPLVVCVVVWTAIGGVTAACVGVDPGNVFLFAFVGLGIPAMLWLIAGPCFFVASLVKARRASTVPAQLGWVGLVPCASLLILGVLPVASWLAWPSEDQLIARFHEQRADFARIRELYRAEAEPIVTPELDRIARKLGGDRVHLRRDGLSIDVWSVGLTPDGIAMSYVLSNERPGELVPDLSEYVPDRDHFWVYRHLDGDWFLEREEW